MVSQHAHGLVADRFDKDICLVYYSTGILRVTERPSKYIRVSLKQALCILRFVTYSFLNRGRPDGCLTFILLTWRIWRDPNNASKWQMGFNWSFKGLYSLTPSLIRAHSEYLVCMLRLSSFVSSVQRRFYGFYLFISSF
jgi:hypothetical protein